MSCNRIQARIANTSDADAPPALETAAPPVRVLYCLRIRAGEETRAMLCNPLPSSAVSSRGGPRNSSITNSLHLQSLQLHLLSFLPTVRRRGLVSNRSGLLTRSVGAGPVHVSDTSSIKMSELVQGRPSDRNRSSEAANRGRYALEEGAGGNAGAPEGAEGETGGHFEW